MHEHQYRVAERRGVFLRRVVPDPWHHDTLEGAREVGRVLGRVRQTADSPRYAREFMGRMGEVHTVPQGRLDSVGFVTTVDSTRHGSPRPLLSPRTLELLEQADSGTLSDLTALRDEVERFLMRYRFGLSEVETKLNILRDEFNLTAGYNPIESISCRVKTMEGVLEKAARKGIDLDLEAIKEGLSDIAGVRVICSFVSDVYRIVELLTSQDDITVLLVKDYIEHPKPNGYRSLHVILEVPVFLSGGPEQVRVEVQFRTIAMDFWASLEHKTYYKYDAQVPQHLIDGLTEAAETAAHLDATMERLHLQVRGHEPPVRTMRV